MQERTDRKFVLWHLVVLTIVILIIIITVWLGYGRFKIGSQNDITETTLIIKIGITIFGIIVLLVSYWMFKHQEKLDRQKQLNKQFSII